MDEFEYGPRNFRVDPQTGEIIYEIAGAKNTVTGEPNYKYLNSYTYVYEYKSLDENGNVVSGYYTITTTREQSWKQIEKNIEEALEDVEEYFDFDEGSYSIEPVTTSGYLVGAYSNLK